MKKKIIETKTEELRKQSMKFAVQLMSLFESDCDDNDTTKVEYGDHYFTRVIEQGEIKLSAYYNTDDNSKQIMKKQIYDEFVKLTKMDINYYYLYIQNKIYSCNSDDLVSLIIIKPLYSIPTSDTYKISSYLASIISSTKSFNPKCIHYKINSELNSEKPIETFQVGFIEFIYNPAMGILKIKSPNYFKENDFESNLYHFKKTDLPMTFCLSKEEYSKCGNVDNHVIFCRH